MRFQNILKSSFFIIIFSFFLILLQSYPAKLFIKYVPVSEDNIWFTLISGLSGFLVMFLIPALIFSLVFKKPLSDFGLSIPQNHKESVRLTCIVIVILLPLLCLLSLRADFQNYYYAGQGVVYFLFGVIASSFYYFAEEFLFRGLLHFGLWGRFKFHTFWIINIIFALFHFEKPPIEIFLAFFIGIALNYLSFKTKSFIPAFIVHFTIALIVNILVTFVFPPPVGGTFHF